MAKKKAKKASKKAVKVAPDPLWLEVKEMDLESATAKKEELMHQLQKIRRNRNYYMLERDAIQQYHFVVCQENEELQAQIKNLESEMEERQRAHKDTIQIYLQKVTHLEYEHAHNLEIVDEEKQADLRDAQQAYEQKKASLLQLKSDVEREFAAEERKHEADIKAKQESNRDTLLSMRKHHETEHEKLKRRYQKRLEELISDLQLRRKIDIHEVEERKNSHINKLIENHDNSFNSMRKYYNSLTKDNLGLIKALKDELENLKKKQRQHEDTIADYRARNKQLKHPKEQAEKEVAELQEKLKNYEKDKISLKHSKDRIVALTKTLTKMRKEQESLEARYKKARSECKHLIDTFQEAVTTVKKQGEAKNLKLEQHLKSRSTLFTEKKAHFNELLQIADLDPVALGSLTSKLDSELTGKTSELKELRYENSKLSKAHDDLVRVYEAKIRKFGIPETENGARTLIGSTQSTTAPADLIV